jgi:hypothetical protein
MNCILAAEIYYSWYGANVRLRAGVGLPQGRESPLFSHLLTCDSGKQPSPLHHTSGNSLDGVTRSSVDTARRLQDLFLGVCRCSLHDSLVSSSSMALQPYEYC